MSVWPVRPHMCLFGVLYAVLCGVPGCLSRVGQVGHAEADLQGCQDNCAAASVTEQAVSDRAGVDAHSNAAVEPQATLLPRLAWLRNACATARGTACRRPSMEWRESEHGVSWVVRMYLDIVTEKNIRIVMVMDKRRDVGGGALENNGENSDTDKIA